MIELALIVALEAGALVLALALARLSGWGRDAGGARRVVAAIERASDALLARERTRQAPIAAGLSLVAFGAEALFGRADVGVARAAGVLLGAGLGAGIGAAAARLGSRAGAATVEAARSRFDHALTTALRLGGAAGLGAQAVGALGGFTLLLTDHLLRSGESLSRAASLSASGLPGYAIGAALSAITIGRASAAYGVAAEAGSSRAALRTPSIDPADPRNPALVSSLVALELAWAARTTRAFATSAVFTTLALVLPASARLTGVDALSFAALPLIVPAFGAVASTVGLLVTRTEENSHAALALLRGLASTTWVLVLGVAGASYWLYPDFWATFAGAGAAGVVALVLGSLSLFATAEGRRGTLSTARSLAQAGSGPLVGWSLGGGLRHAALLLLLASAAAVLSQSLGAATGMPFGDRLGPLVTLSAALSASPFLSGVDALAGAAEGARGMAGMAPADAETARRVKRLEDTTRSAAAVARSYLATATGFLAGSLGLALPVTSDAPSQTPLLLVALGSAGAGLGLFYASLAARGAAYGAGDAAAEVTRRLEGTGSETPALTPNYRTCEEQCARAALVNGPWDAAVASLSLVLLGIALELVYRSGSPRLAAEAFAVVTAGAAAAALWVALTANGASAVLFAVRRAIRPEGDAASFAASVSAGSLADILGNAASPAACSLALMATSIGLSTPFFR